MFRPKVVISTLYSCNSLTCVDNITIVLKNNFQRSRHVSLSQYAGKIKRGRAGGKAKYDGKIKTNRFILVWLFNGV